MELLNLEIINNNPVSLNSLSPYIGKMRPELAHYLISRYSEPNGIIYDPFAGSGTVLLEGWAAGHAVVGTDLNYYAYILSLGKLNPYHTLEEAVDRLTIINKIVEKRMKKRNNNDIPTWVREFYHPDTLNEICCWVYCLKKNREWFILSCLLGILHHQRPGFLSYPASHGAPYLRNEKYPQESYPEMYEYKNVYDKLYRKIKRSYRHIPKLDYSLSRTMLNKDAAKANFNGNHFSTIITSPPYMKSLTYARDNRLRLWFLGEQDWISLDKKISPDKNTFIETMEKCFAKWAKLQVVGDKCVIVIGDINITYKQQKTTLADTLIDISQRYYSCVEMYQDPIPKAKKVVKNNSNIKQEIIIVFERK